MTDLISLEEHNKKHGTLYDFTRPRRNGIACPDCGCELIDSNPSTVLASYLASIVRLVTTMAPASDLSPAAQAVLDATGRKTWYRNDDIAAALRAAASQLAYGHTDHPIIDEKALLAIADELEA